MNIETTKTKKRYDRYSKFYNAAEFLFESKLFKKWRRSTIKSLSGRVLEIGVGTGKNLKYYSSSADVIGIDISEGMLEKAVKEADKLDRDYELLYMDAQDLNFKDNEFDFVVSTFVLCSIPDPNKALKEIQRVLKPGGYFISIDHVLSKKKLLSFWQQIHNPLTKYLFGFNVNRDTRKNIETSGFSIKKDENLAFYDVFRRFTCYYD